MPVIWLLILIFWANLGQPGASAAAAASGGNLEELRYRVSLGVCQDVARVHLRLTQVGPDRYRAEFAGAAQGVWSLLSRWLPERYETEMVLEDGRLKPLVYREKFQAKGHSICKEFRFDYARGILEVWRGVDGQEPVKSWQVPLKEPVYDPLSLFYNLRLGAFGPLMAGQTLKVAVIPTPEPQEMIFRIGPETDQGRKVMLKVVSPQASQVESGPYYIFCTPQQVPQQAWTRVPLFGKLSGQLLNPGEIMQEGLPALPRLSRHSKETNPRN
jgi:hypothetical protein